MPVRGSGGCRPRSTRGLDPPPSRPGPRRAQRGAGCRPAGASQNVRLLAVRGTEETDRERDAALLELVQEGGPKPGRTQASDDGAVGSDSIDLEVEDVLKGDDLRFHPLNLRDGGDAAAAVLETFEMDDEGERRGDLLPDRSH